MAFSAYLSSVRQKAKQVVNGLLKHFKYVSLLATDNTGTAFMVDRNNSLVREGSGECGFVLKMHDGRAFYEYSFSDISAPVEQIVNTVLQSVKCTSGQLANQI